MVFSSGKGDGGWTALGIYQLNYGMVQIASACKKTYPISQAAICGFSTAGGVQVTWSKKASGTLDS
ncbi:MAG TPA: hypothetical protein DCF45_04900 [Gammaproteobacteria bacterium]|nr:hypothetical protein [Gammaproteobacteria bacterium]